MLKNFFASDLAVRKRLSNFPSSSTIFIPFPPPPPAAFIKIGYPISLQIDFASVKDDVKKVKSDSLTNIKKILSENKKIVGYGAPAKATTILNYFGLNENYFKYVVEDSEIKQGKYIPETNIQIISKDDINTEDFEFVLVLAWNFYDSIVKNNKSYFKNSKFIKLK